ncbi:NAD(P)H-dependent oxidoreductase [Maribacter cobaltidurans]|uniref:NAD(P)H-dependent oxidoreductase n=1 Tax=Maribacter cobaltidurans TaxID=1178778 RepID=A0A223V7M3_9FLAO|nr:NAD(P)H-dependent oxidoreductase [Maribacter cobaltidurans]ASV31286.1 NAD(P)H-dependent oxidoreductase [Maribacter cobaltidurans]GGD83561.1 NAD(P)H-dependent oxidoreductase [Maribacter cobaltidurans]
MKEIIKDLNWRYATKKFDTTKKVSPEDLNTLLEATRLSASSYGLQPYHIFVVENKEIRERLKPHSWNQSQITDASHLLIFSSRQDFGEELIDEYLANVMQTRGLPGEAIKGYSEFMKSKLMSLSDTDKSIWTSRQAYIALGNLMTVAASLKIDTCAMEGFESEKYDEILGLEDQDLTTTVVLAIGYRSSSDETQHLAKVRHPKEKLFTHI